MRGFSRRRVSRRRRVQRPLPLVGTTLAGSTRGQRWARSSLRGLLSGLVQDQREELVCASFIEKVGVLHLSSLADGQLLGLLGLASWHLEVVGGGREFLHGLFGVDCGNEVPIFVNDKGGSVRRRNQCSPLQRGSRRLGRGGLGSRGLGRGGSASTSAGLAWAGWSTSGLAATSAGAGGGGALDGLRLVHFWKRKAESATKPLIQSDTQRS